MNPAYSILHSVTIYAVVSIFAGIYVHELGHLLAARLLGIKVLSVSIGFGPEIIGFTDSLGTRWKAAPLLVGGSCCFLDRPVANEDMSPDSSRRLRALSEASPQDRAIIYAAGPIFNLCFAGAISLLIFYHSSLFPFLPDEEAEFGLLRFFNVVSMTIGLFNLLPIPPLDGGCLALIALDACRGSPIAKSDEQRLIKIGSWFVAGITAIMALLILIQIGSSNF
jgi:membrane-associated protease RseP (regulator of RpoE activity)